MQTICGVLQVCSLLSHARSVALSGYQAEATTISGPLVTIAWYVFRLQMKEKVSRYGG